MSLWSDLIFDEIEVDGKTEYFLSYTKIALFGSLFVNGVLFLAMIMMNFVYFVIGCRGFH